MKTRDEWRERHERERGTALVRSPDSRSRRPRGLSRRPRSCCLAIICAALIMTAGGSQALDIQGHRGARGLAPENTLPAFARALGDRRHHARARLRGHEGRRGGGEPRLRRSIPTSRAGLTASGSRRRGRRDPRASPSRSCSATTSAGINPASAYAKRLPEQQPVDGTRMPRLADLFALVRKSGNDDGALQHRDQDLAACTRSETAAPEDFARAVDHQPIRTGGHGAPRGYPVLRLAHARRSCRRKRRRSRPSISPRSKASWTTSRRTSRHRRGPRACTSAATAARSRAW